MSLRRVLSVLPLQSGCMEIVPASDLVVFINDSSTSVEINFGFTALWQSFSLPLSVSRRLYIIYGRVSIPPLSIASSNESIYICLSFTRLMITSHLALFFMGLLGLFWYQFCTRPPFLLP